MRSLAEARAEALLLRRARARRARACRAAARVPSSAKTAEGLALVGDRRRAAMRAASTLPVTALQRGDGRAPPFGRVLLEIAGLRVGHGDRRAAFGHGPAVAVPGDRLGGRGRGVDADDEVGDMGMGIAGTRARHSTADVTARPSPDVTPRGLRAGARHQHLDEAASPGSPFPSRRSDGDDEGTAPPRSRRAYGLQQSRVLDLGVDHGRDRVHALLGVAAIVLAGQRACRARPGSRCSRCRPRAACPAPSPSRCRSST